MFEKKLQLRNNRIAFLPDTFKRFRTSHAVAAYWHETKSGKPIVACGVFALDIGSDTEDKLRESNRFIQSLSYTEFLNVARKQVYDEPLGSSRGYDQISQLSSVKLGHSKPWRNRDVDKYYYPELGQIHDDQELLAMQANPNYIPVGADGWYTLSKKQVF